MSANPGTRGIARHTLIYGLGTLLQKGVSFLMLPLYTRLLTPADYGVLALIDMTLDVISIGAGAQLAYAIYRFYHKADTAAGRDTVISTVFTSLLVSYTATGILVAVFAEPLARLVFGGPEHTVLIRIAAGGMISQCLLIVPFAFLQVTERSAAVASASLVKLVLQLGLNILFLVGLRAGVAGILVSTLLSNLAVGGALSVWTIRRVGFSFSADALRSLVRYAGPMMVMQMATFFATFGDRYFLKAYHDEAMVGLYNLSYQFGFLLFAVGFGPFNGMWAPRRFAIAKSDDHEERDRDLSAGFGYANLLLMAVAVGLALFVDDILRVMTTPAFHEAGAAVPIILVAYVLLAWSNMHDLGILVRERTEFLTIANWIALAVALAGWAVLVPRYGALGAAWAGSISFGVRYALTYAFSQRLWYVRYNWAPTVRMCGVGALVVVGARLLPPLSLVASVPLHAALLAVYLWFLWLAGPLTPENKSAIIQMVRRVLARRGAERIPPTASS